MIRTSTPTHRFEIAEDQSSIIEMLQALKITYKQGNRVVLEKTEADVTIEGNVISFKLTQEETKRFVAGVPIDMQVRVLLTSGECFPSLLYRMSCSDVLDDEVME